MHDPDVGVQLYLLLGNLDLERVCPHDSFSKIPTIGDQYFGKDFGGIEDSKQKGVDWYVFCIFSYFFMHTPIFWGIKPLYHHFWKFCSLEFMKDINRNLFMPISTNSDAFRSPKKSVCKFDDFDCPQL